MAASLSRRQFLRTSAFLPFIPLVDWGAPKVAPNFLVIVTDDQMLSTMPYMTKTLARFASGVEFSKHYVTTPLCAPSRASMQTGRLVRNHEIDENRHAARRFRNLRYGGESFANLLKTQAGYDCGFFGKWTNNYDEVASYKAAGYREWVARLNGGNTVQANINGNIRKTGVAKRDETSWFATKVESFIASATEPWLAYFCPTAPHNPYYPSAAHEHDFDTEPLPDHPNFDYHDPEKPKHIRNIDPLTNQEKQVMTSDFRGKLEELMDVDDAVDSLFNAIDENTYVIFTSDNGYLLGEHRMYLKGAVYEEASHVPLYITGPAVREGVSTNLLSANIDIAPTLLDIAGLMPEEVAPQMDGRSLVGPLYSDESEIEWRDCLLSEMHAAGHYEVPWRAIRTSESVYVEHGTGEREYYDLAADPYQLNNAVSEMDAVSLHQMSTRLSQLKQSDGEDLRTAETSV